MSYPSRPKVQSTKAKAPSVAQVLSDQERQAEAATKVAEARKAKAIEAAMAAPETPKRGVPATAAKAVLPAAPDGRTTIQKYLDDNDPASVVGAMVKFSKDGTFIRNDTDEAIDEQTIFILHADQTMIGLIRFRGPGEPPDRHMGLLFDGYCPPDRSTLGDTDESEWEIGLSGLPADPWQSTNYVVLENADNHEMLTFVTNSKTGRRAVAKVLRHYERMRKTDAEFYPLVQLRTSGFEHPDSQVGFVKTPLFAVVGRVPRSDAAQPAASGNSAEFNDDIPY